MVYEKKKPGCGTWKKPIKPRCGIQKRINTQGMVHKKKITSVSHMKKKCGCGKQKRKNPGCGTWKKYKKPECGTWKNNSVRHEKGNWVWQGKTKMMWQKIKSKLPSPPSPQIVGMGEMAIFFDGYMLNFKCSNHFSDKSQHWFQDGRSSSTSSPFWGRCGPS